MKIRNYYNKHLFSIIVASMVLGACNKSVLNIVPTNPTEQSFFTNELEFSRGIFGIYSKLSDFYWYNGSQASTTVPLIYLPGDDITCPDIDEFEQFGPLQPASGRIDYFYRTNYQVVARANVMLQKIAEAPQGIYVTPNLANHHRGEALFLRGHAFFQLWNYFGTAPVVTERITTTAALRPPASQGNQLLDQAIADFTEAAQLLPASWNAANRGRVTANAANGYLGKALVFRATVTRSTADYTAAIQAFGRISGAVLVPAFDDNFAANTENNAESLFEFQASSPFGTDNVWLSNDFDNSVGSMSAFWGFYDNNFALFGKGRHLATSKYINVFEAGDPRRALSLDAANGHIRKYVTRNVMTGTGVGSANNPRILRYADVLLLWAEALVQSNGSTSQAIGLINQVRTRARNMVVGGTIPADFNTAEADRNRIMGWIMDERLRELGGEGLRWYDIRRWHIAGTIQLNNAFFSSTAGNVSFTLPRHLLLPIPNSEIDLNPNVLQNQGY